jgi:DNA replication and repair protein RecF
LRPSIFFEFDFALSRCYNPPQEKFMRLIRLALTHFRNYPQLDLDFPSGATLVQGNNAGGKTSLLEAIFYIATSKSPRASSDRELIRWGASEEPIPFSRIEADVERSNGIRTQIEIVLQQADEKKIGDASKPNGRVVKRIKVNGVIKRALDLLGELNVVLFLPEDLDLVFGSPGARRRYLDVTLSQIDPRYGRAMVKYNQILEQRNSLLRDMRERSDDPMQLAIWDQQLVAEGTYIIARRTDAIMRYNHLVQNIHPRLTDSSEELHLLYQPSVVPDTNGTFNSTGKEMRVAGIARAFGEQLQTMHARELASAQTLVGPHRDDIRFLIQPSNEGAAIDANTYASRGQGRTIALSLKLAEVALMRAETGEDPILLLDDVMSELDAPRRAALARVVMDAPQAILTTTDLADLPNEFVENVRVLHVSDGIVTRES